MAKVGRLVKDMMLQELTQALDEKPNFFVASLERLSAIETDTLRKRLRGMQVRVRVVKRTLGLRGVGAKQLKDAQSLFQGSVALVLPGEDIIPVAKLLVDFAKSSEDRLAIRGGWVDGQLLDQKRTQELANLPPKPQLIAQVIGAIESPLADVVMTLEGVLRELAWVLEEAGKTRPKAEEPAPAAPRGSEEPGTQGSASDVIQEGSQ